MSSDFDRETLERALQGDNFPTLWEVLLSTARIVMRHDEILEKLVNDRRSNSQSE